MHCTSHVSVGEGVMSRALILKYLIHLDAKIYSHVMLKEFFILYFVIFFPSRWQYSIFLYQTALHFDFNTFHHILGWLFTFLGH